MNKIPKELNIKGVEIYDDCIRYGGKFYYPNHSFKEFYKKDKTQCDDAEFAELHDRFAMAALTGMLGESDYVTINLENGLGTDFFASQAYELDDAMLAARNKGANPPF